ncbi:unnamed protein product [Litomosoides sigmodontis]|uniref:Uncharacterized protein n=1 Tax=Litomosoides sigmodontis TaxID=42156 RepID=A0A3P6RUG4_LITSI|nr:unnamed protein product [Litomosoides sigmodontis]
MEERGYSTSHATSAHISAEPSTGTFKGKATAVDGPSAVDHIATNSLQPSGKSKSFADTSTKLTLSRTYSSTDHFGNLHPSKTHKKPVLIRSETIDLPGSSGDSDHYSVNTNLRMKHDPRPHLLVSFFAKHFEKMHRRMTKRPLGSSLSFDPDERQRMHALQHGSDSQDKSIISLLTNTKHYNSLHIDLNCFHCVIDASLRERKLSRLESGVQLWNSSDISSVQCTDPRQRNSKFNTNCKVPLHDSTHVTNKCSLILAIFFSY